MDPSSRGRGRNRGDLGESPSVGGRRRRDRGRGDQVRSGSSIGEDGRRDDQVGDSPDSSVGG